MQGWPVGDLAGNARTARTSPSTFTPMPPHCWYWPCPFLTQYLLVLTCLAAPFSAGLSSSCLPPPQLSCSGLFPGTVCFTRCPGHGPAAKLCPWLFGGCGVSQHNLQLVVRQLLVWTPTVWPQMSLSLLPPAVCLLPHPC